MKARAIISGIVGLAILAIMALVLGPLMGRSADNHAATAAESPPPIAWQTDLQAALADAARQAKPVFIQFHAPWCGYCRLLDTDTLTDPRVRQALGDFVALKIDVDKDPVTRETFAVGPIPALFITDTGGKVLHQRLGYLPPDEFLKMLETGKTRFTAGTKGAVTDVTTDAQ